MAQADFDVEAYASQFKGPAKSNRLLFIAKNSKGEIEAEAYRLAIQELKKGFNVKLYTEAVTAAVTSGACPELHLDSDWIKAKEIEVSTREADIEHQLKINKSNILTDSIRLSFQDQGDLMYAKGSANDALKCYARAKDYCTQGNHVLTCALNAIRVSLDSKNMMNVQNNVLTAEQSPDLKDNVIVIAKVDAAYGLAQMELRNYKVAARRFVKVSGGSSFDWSDVTSPQEIALYGALCGLATFSRDELRSEIIGNISFREFLDTFPKVRELVNDFFNSQYTAFLNGLENLETRLRLDLRLHSHAKWLCSSVRSRALIQYTTPFTSVSLQKMAAAFSTDQRALEEDIVRLIQKGDILARIDSRNQVLHKRKPNAQAVAYRASLAAGEEYLRSTKALLVRASLQRFNMIQSGNSGGGKNKGGYKNYTGGFSNNFTGGGGGLSMRDAPPGLQPMEAENELFQDDTRILPDDEEGSIDEQEPAGVRDGDVLMQDDDPEDGAEELMRL